MNIFDIFFTFHCEAVAHAINLILWSRTMLQIMHQLCIDLSRDFKYFDNAEIRFPSDKLKVCSIFTGNQNKPRVHGANTKPGFVLFSVNI